MSKPVVPPQQFSTPTQPTGTLPPPGPGRPRSPTLKQLFAANAPVFAKNVRRPASSIQIDYKNAFGQTAELPFLLPVTDVPVQLDEHVPYESLKTSTALAKAIMKGAIRLYWPDEAAPLQTAEALEDINEALTYAQNPNQEGYFPDRESDDVLVDQDEKEMATAAESQPLNGRVVAIVAQLGKGSLGAQRAIRELQSVQRNLSYRDYQHLLASLGDSEPEEVVREWVVQAINAMDMGVGVSSPDHPGAAGPARLMRQAEAAQYGRGRQRARTHVMNPAAAAAAGPSRGGVSQAQDEAGNPVVIVDR